MSVRRIHVLFKRVQLITLDKLVPVKLAGLSIGIRHYRRSVAPVLKELTIRKKKFIQPSSQRSNFLDWNHEAEIYAFNTRLSEKFDLEKLLQAFTDKSYIIKEENRQRNLGIEEPKLEMNSNEHFIENGLELTSKYIHKYLQNCLPRVPEDGVIALCNYLLSEEVLSKVSIHLGTTDIILTEEYPVNKSTLANTFLALVGALNESTNENHASLFVRDFLITALADKDLTEIYCPNEPMKTLNDILMHENKEPAEARLIGQTGTNTLIPAYEIGIYTNKKFLGSGFGETIEEAKNVATLNALYRIFGLLDSSQPIKYDIVDLA